MQSKVIAMIGMVCALLMTCRFYRVWAVNAALLAGLLAGCTTPEQAPAPSAVMVRVIQTQRLMGVPWTITVHAESDAAGRAAIAAGFAEVARLESLLSDYDPGSELSRLSALAPTAQPQHVSDDLWRVLGRAVEIRDATNGAFDPTVGPLTSLWRQARRSGRMPLPDKLAAARAAVGPETLRLVPASRGVVLTQPAMRLDLGGIGMGYAIDRAVEVLGRQGITAAMIDASGDIAVSAAPPGAAGWTIAVASLRAAGDGEAAGVGEATGVAGETLVLTHAAVTTSGDAFQAVEIDGRRYSHIVDPRTGLGVAGPAAVTVVAPDCATADALATAASVLGPGQAAAFIDGSPGCAARFVWLKAGQIRQFQTAGWPARTSQNPE